MKHIMIVGAGSVGGFFGAHLGRRYPNVTFLLRPGTQAALEKNGLTIQSAIGDSFTIHPQSASDPKELPAPDLIILGIKAYDLEETMNQLEPVLRPTTTILTLQNGVTIEDRLTRRFGPDRIVGGVAFIYSKILEPGVIAHYKKGMVAIGELMGMESPRAQAIAQLFLDAGISCTISRDIRRSKWEKMCWNCVFNPLTVLLNDCVAKALDHPELQTVISTIVREVSAVAMAAHRIPLSEDMPEKVVKASQEVRDIHTSMYDDWKAGRGTEIDDLNGYISRKGKELGIPTPMNDFLTALLSVMAPVRETQEPEIVIEGDVYQPIHFTRRILGQLPSNLQVEDLGTVMPGMSGKALRVKALLDVATLNPGVDHVTFYSQDGNYSACLTLQQAKDFGMLWYEQSGAAVPSDRGGPFRLVTPGLGDLCANVKQVHSIVLTKGEGRDTRPPQVCAEEGA